MIQQEDPETPLAVRGPEAGSLAFEMFDSCQRMVQYDREHEDLSLVEAAARQKNLALRDELGGDCRAVARRW